MDGSMAELEKFLWEGRNKFFPEKTLGGRAEMKKKILTHEIANKYTNGLRPKGAGTLPGPH
jgi:hypothetical protein